ncbi:MAG: Ser-Thr-rich GPI-anchored membrane family protein [Patescibacteria group bacterium]
MNINQKGFANIILIVVIIVLMGAVGYFALIQKTASVVKPEILVNQLADWKTYRMDEYGFEVKYPLDMEVQQLGPFGVGYFKFVFQTPNNGKDYVVGMTIDFRTKDELGAMREALDQNSSSMTEIDIAGTKGTKVVGFYKSINQTGPPVNEIWIPYYQRINILRGKGDIFDKMVSTFKFVEIKLVSPMGSDRWQVGNTYPIKWTVSDGIDKVDIRFGTNPPYGNDIQTIAKDVDAKSGVYNWTIPQDTIDNFISNYSIREVPFYIWVSQKKANTSYYGVESRNGEKFIIFKP